ncbi:hypothetical protein VA7868_04600 [Vibrio aerogenes CECT 7868]|uniref:Uncharacterized protein n=1 Tax=Vibrio aerogenes CECT 7868 TaxID=1216006 RepID=A0A1M6F9J2_9VIBR|nr:hypothetical protein [Vibrio aerogenes]SHI94345.1 hypothetical protein VA7868_04600 [Vibrio aerogenes CECT 7868]
MKRFILLALAATSVASFSASADVWSRLKTTPATKYDVGRIYLDIAAPYMTEQLQGEKIKHTKYRVKKIESVTTGGRLGFKFSFEAKEKYIKKDDCAVFLAASKRILPSDKMISDIWPDLSDSSKKKIAEEFVFEADLVNKDTGDILVKCRI